jgi:hypothetical protein
MYFNYSNDLTEKYYVPNPLSFRLRLPGLFSVGNNLEEIQAG